MSTIGNLIERLSAVRGELAQVREQLTALDALTREVHERAAALSTGLAESFVPILDGVESTTAGIVAALDTAEETINTAQAIADGTFRAGGAGEYRARGSQPRKTVGAGAGLSPRPATRTARFDPAPYLDDMPKREPPRRGQPRQKTHGRLIRADGTAEHLLSGEFGDDYRGAYERAWDLGVAPRPWKFDNASHVEVKVATRMYKNWVREQRPQHETIVLNNRPCWFNPLDCDNVIGAFLPPGSTLTVYAPDGFQKTYRAREAQ